MAVSVKMTLVIMAVSLASLMEHVASDLDVDWELLCSQGINNFRETLDKYTTQLQGKEDLNHDEQIVLDMSETRRRGPELCTYERVQPLYEIVNASPEFCRNFLEKEIAGWCQDCMKLEYNKLISSHNDQLKSALDILEFLQGKFDSRVYDNLTFELEVAEHLAGYFSDPNRHIKRTKLMVKKSFGKIFDDHVKKACETLFKKTEILQPFEKILKGIIYEEEYWSEESSFWAKRRRTCDNILVAEKEIKKHLKELNKV